MAYLSTSALETGHDGKGLLKSFSPEVVVVGSGTIGLPMAAMLASVGIPVAACDLNEDRIHGINTGELPGVEEPLVELVKEAVRLNNLRGCLALPQAETYMICVPTPSTCASDGHPSPDLSAVRSATLAVSKVARPGCLVILESTVPVGATEEVVGALLQRETGLVPGVDFDLCYCPERVLPGNLIEEIRQNDRVIGGTTPRASARAAALYSCICDGELLPASVRTAEAVKLIENSYRDVNIAFANELAWLLPQLGVDVWEARDLANHHPRVNIHMPGSGVGGHCLPIDPWFLVASLPEKAQLIRAAREVNDSVPHRIAELLLAQLAGISRPKVCLLGLAYKPDVDDCRESPSLELAALLMERGCEVGAYDPVVTHSALPQTSLAEAADGAQAAVLLVGHSEFRALDLALLASQMTRPWLLDTQDLLSPLSAAAVGLEVARLGAPEPVSNLEVFR